MKLNSVFDFSITYYNSFDEDFINKEGNFLLVWGEENDIPLLCNPSVIFNVLLIGLGVDIFLLYRKKQNIKNSFLCLLFIFLFIVVSIAHFLGGYSWIYVK